MHRTRKTTNSTTDRPANLTMRGTSRHADERMAQPDPPRRHGTGDWRSVAARAALVSAATLTIAAFTVSGCTTVNDDASPDLSSSAASQPPTDGSTTASSSGAPPISLGDLGTPNPQTVGAPFDPCTVVDWDTFPTEVRPTGTTATTPQPLEPTPADDFTIGCDWHNSETVQVVPGAGDAAPTPTLFSAWITWGQPPSMTADPAQHTDSREAQFGKAPGAIKSVTDTEAGESACIAWAELQDGVASVSVINSRFPDTDPCVVVEALLTEIGNEFG